MAAKRIADLQVGDLIRPEHVELLGDGSLLTVIGIIDGAADSRFVMGAQRAAGSDRINTVAGPYPAAGVIATEPGFGCPHCLRVSHHPTDGVEGWCGACGIYWPRFSTTTRRATK